MIVNRNIVISFLILVFLSGCASVPEEIASSRIGSIKKIAIATKAVESDCTVLDHTGVWQKTYTGYQFGALGGLIEGAILAAEADHKKKKSLGGSIETLTKCLRDFNVKPIIDQELVEFLASKYEIVEPDHFDVISTNDSEEGYLELAKEEHADTFIKVEYTYGLAAYAEESASAAIDVQLEVYDVATKQALLKKAIKSDAHFKKSRTVDEFAANNAELFKRDIVSASEALSKLVGSELGVEPTTPQS